VIEKNFGLNKPNNNYKHKKNSKYEDLLFGHETKISESKINTAKTLQKNKSNIPTKVVK